MSGNMKKGLNCQGKSRKFEKKKRGKSRKSQGILTGYRNLKVLSLLKLISVSSRILYQEIRENSLRSGKMKTEKSGHPEKVSMKRRISS